MPGTWRRRFRFPILLVGTFLISNTFSILVAQRTRELALLRTVGASRTQVLLSVLLVLGVLAGSAVHVAATDYASFITTLPRVAARHGIRLFEVQPADESLESVFAYLVGR